ncbi:hypothetical protein [Acidianus sp. HS-5]|uniref:hypothetical protein n=1 Tax=Acidianus sp. HS-5 TaxID=2886040 RepID=UPI001F1AFD68|nr:hypothetical protein [Acidianus sp. HS-5]BDC17948.1 hypothetical protein HS5_08380 [Acidianus sp. HS-5]
MVTYLLEKEINSKEDPKVRIIKRTDERLSYTFDSSRISRLYIPYIMKDKMDDITETVYKSPFTKLSRISLEELDKVLLILNRYPNLFNSIDFFAADEIVLSEFDEEGRINGRKKKFKVKDKIYEISGNKSIIAKEKYYETAKKINALKVEILFNSYDRGFKLSELGNLLMIKSKKGHKEYFFDNFSVIIERMLKKEDIEIIRKYKGKIFHFTKDYGTTLIDGITLKKFFIDGKEGSIEELKRISGDFSTEISKHNFTWFNGHEITTAQGVKIPHAPYDYSVDNIEVLIDVLKLEKGYFVYGNLNIYSYDYGFTIKLKDGKPSFFKLNKFIKNVNTNNFEIIASDVPPTGKGKVIIYTLLGFKKESSLNPIKFISNDGIRMKKIPR